MIFRSMLISSILIFIALQCGTSKEIVVSSEESNNQTISNIYYNTDSTYYVSEDIVSISEGIPANFYVINLERKDTIYRSNRKFKFLNWESNNLIKLRKKVSVTDRDNPSDLKEGGVNKTLYYLNVNTQNVSLIQSKTK